MWAKHAKNCYFYAEIIKFDLILSHLSLLGGNWGKYLGVQMPHAPPPWHRHCPNTTYRNFLNTKFPANYPPISRPIPFLIEKHQKLPKLGAFSSNTPNLCNLGSFISDENPPIAIPNFTKKHLKKQAHTRIPCRCENPPSPHTSALIVLLFWLL